MSLIQLHIPVPSGPEPGARYFTRVHMFPGRHLGEEEFDREQEYADLRLASLLRGRSAGVVHGLEINLGPNGVAGDSFSVTSGLALDCKGRAVNLYYPLRIEWQELISDYQKASGETDLTGIYSLLLQRSNNKLDSPACDPCQRLDLDPSRDTRLVVTGHLVLQRLNIAPESVASQSREWIENAVAADRVDGEFMATLNYAVPLALLAIEAVGDDFVPHWLSTEAGRYQALPNSGYRVLLNQTNAAMRRIMQAAANEVSSSNPLPQYLQEHLQLDFLPAAGQLPLEWLQNPASTAPTLLWLPQHLGVDMVPVPEESVAELINRHLARRVIDLRQAAGDKIRLLLAVNEPDYRNDLLDFPQTDSQLEADIYRFYMRAHNAWRKWHEQFDHLYALDPEQDQYSHLGLPEPETAPLAAFSFYSALIARAASELSDETTSSPYPYSGGIPAPPNAYSQWLVDGAAPTVPDPPENGLVVQYAVAQVELEAIENQIRAIRSRLEKSRDLLLLMRQQLDSQTVALASLAGGVAGDGSGLKVARWLPYANLDSSEAPSDSSVASAVSASKIVTAAARNAAEVKSSGSKQVTGFSSNLLKSVMTTTAFRSSPLLISKPQSFSAFELGINQSRLDKLALLTRDAVTKPAFETKEYRFGVIDHISPEISEYAKAYYGMKELLATIRDLFDPTDATRLQAQLRKVGRADKEGEGPGNENPFERSNRLEAPSVLDNLAKKNSAGDAKKYALLLTQYRYHALFKAGRILTQWIAICESRYNNIERKLQGKLREQVAKIAQLEKLAGQIRVARETLESLDRYRIEQLGDYGVAQRLLDEDWRQVYAVNQERTRILTTALRGLYYVRVRNTPVSAPLADPLSLRHGSSSDIVPGCSWQEDVDLPEALEPFFNTLCEIPMDDWASLKPLKNKVPPFKQFTYLGQLRHSRFKARPKVQPNSPDRETLQARLQTVQKQNRSLLQKWADMKLPVTTVSSVKTQNEAATILSLEDLALSSGLLRKKAQQLRDQLESCVGCLLETLDLLPGSVRLQWGQLAEDDQLRVENVAWWPGLEQAESDDFNAARTLAELISWLTRQLDNAASADSRSALRNMVRAVVIHASLGDPQEIIRGEVFVPPRLARVGERLQVKLNRAPTPGTRLQLLNPAQQVVALLTVEDHGQESTQVNIAELLLPNIKISSNFSVISNKRSKEKL